MNALADLEALRRWLAQSLAAVLREAMAVEEPAGTSPGWQHACAHFQVPSIDDLILTKRFANRPKDLEDIRLLQILKGEVL